KVRPALFLINRIRKFTDSPIHLFTYSPIHKKKSIFVVKCYFSIVKLCGPLNQIFSFVLQFFLILGIKIFQPFHFIVFKIDNETRKFSMYHENRRWIIAVVAEKVFWEIHFF